MKAVLSGQIARFFDADNRLRADDGDGLRQFRLLADALRQLTPDAEAIPLNGIAYRGRPAWLNGALLRQLQLEAGQRRSLPLDRIDHFLGCGGARADVLSVSAPVRAFVEAHVGPVAPTGIASYLYYDQPGLGIRPHVDTEVFSINLMLMLRHSCDGDERHAAHEVHEVHDAHGAHDRHGARGAPSATVVFPARGEPEYYRLRVGEAMIMHGSAVVHTRSLVQPGERVHLLTMGFNRIAHER